MSSPRRLTADEFAENLFDLDDGGRWHELIAGEVVALTPPDEVHGNAVLNLSKALAEHLRTSDQGYACFELGLVVSRSPDTVRCPAVSCFTSGERFAESDKSVTTARPDLVVEIASSNDRRRDARQRVDEYLAWGVPVLWLVDPADSMVHVYQPARPPRSLASHQFLLGNPVLAGFRIRVSDLFAEPQWWRG